jgi:hypothetical protein
VSAERDENGGKLCMVESVGLGVDCDASSYLPCSPASQSVTRKQQRANKSDEGGAERSASRGEGQGSFDGLSRLFHALHKRLAGYIPPEIRHVNSARASAPRPLHPRSPLPACRRALTSSELLHSYLTCVERARNSCQAKRSICIAAERACTSKERAIRERSREGEEARGSGRAAECVVL